MFQNPLILAVACSLRGNITIALIHKREAGGDVRGMTCDADLSSTEESLDGVPMIGAVFGCEGFFVGTGRAICAVETLRINYLMGMGSDGLSR